MPSGPLAGVRVVDFAANMAGPYATQTLGDQGADVIKVEPPDGDVSRSLGNGHVAYSAFFANLNRSKRSLTLDLANTRTSAVLDRLLGSADVVVHSFRPGQARRFGLDYGAVQQRRPDVVHTTITGFGTVGPYAGRPAYDHVIQAVAGFVAAQAEPTDGTPTLIRQGAIDKIVGQTASQAITAALFERAHTGHGREVEVRMLDAAVAFLWPDVMMNHTIDEPAVQRPPIVRSFRLTTTADGHLAFVVVTAQQFGRLAAALEQAGAPVRSPQDQAEVLRATARHLRDLTTAAGVDLLASFDIPVAPVVELDQLHEHPQVRASEILTEFDHPVVGRIRQPRPAVVFGGATSPARRAPRLGEHNAELLEELGFTTSDAADLRAAGVFGEQE